MRKELNHISPPPFNEEPPIDLIGDQNSVASLRIEIAKILDDQVCVGKEDWAEVGLSLGNYTNRRSYISEKRKRDLVKIAQESSDHEQIGLAASRIILADIGAITGIIERYYADSPIPRDELVQIGCEEYFVLIPRYDPDKDASVLTFVYKRIKDAIGRYISDNRYTIRIPDGTQKQLRSLRFIEGQYQFLFASEEELARAAEIPHTSMSRLRAISQPISLESSISPDSDDELGDKIPSKDVYSDPEEQVIANFFERAKLEVVSVLLRQLDERERVVLEMLFLSEKTYSLEEAGTLIGLIKSMVGVIKNQALSKLRKYLSGNSIQFTLLE